MIPGRADGPRALRAWFALALLFAVLSGLLALGEAFSSPYVVQDDQRQHVFWMARYVDPGAFPGDPAADYFQSVAPAGYRAIYRTAAAFGVHPYAFAKALPLFLSLATAAFAFGVAYGVASSGMVAFLGSWALIQNLWLMDDLASATPRAFLYPLFLGFLMAVTRGSGPGTAAAVVGLGLFYPQLVLVAAGVLVLTLFAWRAGRLVFTPEPLWRRTALWGLPAALLVLLPYGVTSSPQGPVITPEEARTLSEFGPGGRSAFFDPEPDRFWLCGERSGAIPREWCEARARHASALPVPLLALTFAAGLAAPFGVRRFLPRPAGWRWGDGLGLWPRVAGASLACFLAAHLFLFRLHLPSRYAQHPLRILSALSLGIAVGAVLSMALAWGRRRGGLARAATLLGAGALGLGVLAAPFAATRVAWHGYAEGRHPELYRYLASLSPGTLVASTDAEAANLAVFAGVRVLASGELAIPYHLGYYRAYRERGEALVRAEVSPDPSVVHAFLERYGVDFWLLRRKGSEPPGQEDPWLAGLRAASGGTGGRPALAGTLEGCGVYEDDAWVLLEAACVRRELGGPGPR